MRTTTRVLLLVPSIAIFLASVAGAAGFQSFSRADQARDSDLIVVGRVEALLSYWNGPQSVIQTDVRVAIEDVWKGDPESDQLTVRTLGGVVDQTAMEVDGAARFEIGERVILFLRKEKATWKPWGMRYGKYRIVGPEEAFALGGLPPNVSGAQRFHEVSIALDELRDEVTSLLEPTGAGR